MSVAPIASHVVARIPRTAPVPCATSSNRSKRCSRPIDRYPLRDGVAYLLGKYARRVAIRHPVLRRSRISPHVLRHSCAVALLQAGVDVTVIRDYLGHASIATTSRYVTSNLQMKRNVLDAFWNRAGLVRARQAPWKPKPQLLRFLAPLGPVRAVREVRGRLYGRLQQQRGVVVIVVCFPRRLRGSTACEQV